MGRERHINTYTRAHTNGRKDGRRGPEGAPSLDFCVWRDGGASPVSLTRSVLHWRRPPTPPSNPPLSRSRLQFNALLISSPCDIAAFPTAIAFISLALSHSLSLSTSRPLSVVAKSRKTLTPNLSLTLTFHEILTPQEKVEELC